MAHPYEYDIVNRYTGFADKNYYILPETHDDMITYTILSYARSAEISSSAILGSSSGMVGTDDDILRRLRSGLGVPTHIEPMMTTDERDGVEDEYLYVGMVIFNMTTDTTQTYTQAGTWV